MLKEKLPRKITLSRYAAVLSTLIVLMALIFIVDTVTDYALAAAVLHTTVLLVATLFLTARTVTILAAAGAVAMCVGIG